MTDPHSDAAGKVGFLQLRRSPTWQNAAAVADHYDELDPIYRRVWGEHVHRGLWATGSETPGEAVEALVDRVGERLRLMPGEVCVDIGCGYISSAPRS